MNTEIADMSMCIKSASSLHAAEALRTFPIPPKKGEFKFFANRIKEPEWDSDDKESQRNNEKYISECLKANVIPFSKVSMKYAEDWQLFVPDASCYNILIPSKKESVDALLNGGKIHKINLETTHYHNEFNAFRQNFLQTLIDKEYVLNSFNLCITTQYHNPDSTLNFNIDNKRSGLILHLGSNISEEKTNKLETWFKELRKYEG